MNNENKLVYRCYLEEIPVLEIYLDGAYKVLTESDPEVAEKMEQERVLLSEWLKLKGKEGLSAEEIDDAFKGIGSMVYRGAISNEERLERFVNSCAAQQKKEASISSPFPGSEFVASDAKYESAFQTLEKFCFSPNFKESFVFCGDPDVQFFGEDEPWITIQEYYRRRGEDLVF